MITNISSLRILSILLLYSLTLSLSSAICDPNDKAALLRIKNHFHNSSVFSAWDPNTNCCTWDSVVCGNDDHPNRVSVILITYSDDIVGQIPPDFGDLPFLDTLSVTQFPNLTGSIPSSITKLTRLQLLDLSSNHLSGPIPDFLSQMKSLKYLYLSMNEFSGPIPASLSLLPTLIQLDLSMNKLTGSIPESFGSFKTPGGLLLQLSYNRLSGPIPSSLGEVNLTYLDITRNRFTGDASFLFRRDQPIDIMSLSQNQFKFDFSKVELPQGLKNLAIDHNQIYGSLPKRLGQLPLYGIDVSHNQLCGPIPAGRRLRWFRPWRFAHNKCLCGLPLALCKNA